MRSDTSLLMDDDIQPAPEAVDIQTMRSALAAEMEEPDGA